MNGQALLGALAGGIVALGVLLVVLGVPWTRRVSLADRIGPYLADAPVGSRLLRVTPAAVRGRGAWRTFRRVGAWLDRRLGSTESFAHRLERAGREPDVVGFRAQQVVAALAGAGVALVVAGAVWAMRDTNPVALLVLIVIGGACGALGLDWWLGEQISRRERLVSQELPTVAEMLVLSVTAGEGIPAALARLSRSGHGVLAGELGLVLADMHSGVPLPQALDALSQRVVLPSVARFVDGLVIALERGTPLAEVLRAQAADAREAGRHAIIAEGGKREIRMMFPVVFLILPVTVLFAVFPGLSMLRLDL